MSKTTQKLVDAQPFLGGLAADPSLRGVMDSLNIALLGIAHHQAKLSDIDAPVIAFNSILQKVEHGQSAYLSWRTLFTGNAGGGRTHSFIEVQPALDYDALSPGAKASEVIRQTARDLGLTPDKGVRVRLTGPVPMSDEEFATLAERADVMGLATFFAVTLMLWLAVRSFDHSVHPHHAVFRARLTTALGLLIAGVFDIISIAFIALFVGFGRDFAIQFSVRYRSERYRDDNLTRALSKAGRRAGYRWPWRPVPRRRVSSRSCPPRTVGGELGFVAGIGMIVAFTLAITFLPALIMLMKPPGEAERVGFRFFAPVDRFLMIIEAPWCAWAP